ncbi:MAG: DUF2314 domain-containing protein [Polyangiaceae bacterium]|nr:DUF2314 domain-containing protein [Polyangiaceae bacterium]
MANQVRLPRPKDAIYLAYIKLKGKDVDLKRLGTEWVRSMADEPLRSALTAYIASEELTVERKRRWWFRDPPKDILRSFGMGAEEERRYQAASHVVAVIAEGSRALAAYSVASGIADALDGVVVDPQGLPRVLPQKLLAARISSDESDAVSKWILCPFSTSDDGLGWMTTTGMSRFGLPNLEMRRIPIGLDDALLSVMNAVAQHIVDAAATGSHNASDVVLDQDQVITQRDLSRAMGRDIAAKQTTVRLAFDGIGRDGMAPFVVIEPPASFKGELGEWYYALLSEFLGRPHHPAPLTLPPGDDALERARQRALAEWPEVRDRFARGLSPQQSLFVKHGFAANGVMAFLWVGVTGVDAGRIAGTLANDGPQGSGLNLGMRVTIAEEELGDWMITEGERREGGYTIDILQAKQRDT